MRKIQLLSAVFAGVMALSVNSYAVAAPQAEAGYGRGATASVARQEAKALRVAARDERQEAKALRVAEREERQEARQEAKAVRLAAREAKQEAKAERVAERAALAGQATQLALSFYGDASPRFIGRTLGQVIKEFNQNYEGPLGGKRLSIVIEIFKGFGRPHGPSPC